MKTQNLVHFGGRLEHDANEVILLKASLNYTFIYFKDGTKKLVATTLGKIENRLPSKLFFRVNRSTVVNLSEARIAMDGACVQIKNGPTILTSRRRKENLIKQHYLK